MNSLSSKIQMDLKRKAFTVKDGLRKLKTGIKGVMNLSPKVENSKDENDSIRSSRNFSN